MTQQFKNFLYVLKYPWDIHVCNLIQFTVRVPGYYNFACIIPNGFHVTLHKIINAKFIDLQFDVIHI